MLYNQVQCSAYVNINEVRLLINNPQLLIKKSKRVIIFAKWHDQNKNRLSFVVFCLSETLGV